MIIQTRITDPDEMQLFINSAKNCGYTLHFGSTTPTDIIKINLTRGNLSYTASPFSPLLDPSALLQFLVRPVKYFEDIEEGDTVEYLKPINYINEELKVGNYYKVTRVLHNYDVKVKGVACQIPRYFVDVVKKDPENIQKRKKREELITTRKSHLTYNQEKGLFEYSDSFIKENLFSIWDHPSFHYDANSPDRVRNSHFIPSTTNQFTTYPSPNIRAEPIRSSLTEPEVWVGDRRMNRWHIPDEIGRLTPEMTDWASRYVSGIDPIVSTQGIYEQWLASNAQDYTGTLTREMLSEAINSIINPPTHDRNISNQSLDREVGEGMGDETSPNSEQ